MVGASLSRAGNQAQDKIMDTIYKDVALGFAGSYESIDAASDAMVTRGLLVFFSSSRALKGAALLGLACHA